MNRRKKGFIPNFMEIVYSKSSITGKGRLVAMLRLETKKNAAFQMNRPGAEGQKICQHKKLEIYVKKSIWIQWG